MITHDDFSGAAVSGEVILTGDRPTGPLHLGHYAGSLAARVRLQGGNRQTLLVADLQALTDNANDVGKVRRNVLEVVKDYVAVGIDPDQTDIVLQSAVPELSELAMLYMNIVTVSRLERNPTIRSEIKQRGFERSLPVGFLSYPVSQAADITAFGATLVPVGEDQLPMIELSNEIVSKVNRMAGSGILVESNALLSRVRRLPGIDGQAKASKSLGNAIFLSEDSVSVRNKVMSMFTDPNHLRVEDPGKVEGNPVFEYLDAFDPDRDGLDEMKAHYARGGLGDVKVKRRLEVVLQEMLEPIRARRSLVSDADAKSLLSSGTYRGRESAAKILQSVRGAFGIVTL